MPHSGPGFAAAITVALALGVLAGLVLMIARNGADGTRRRITDDPSRCHPQTWLRSGRLRVVAFGAEWSRSCVCQVTRGCLPLPLVVAGVWLAAPIASVRRAADGRFAAQGGCRAGRVPGQPVGGRDIRNEAEHPADSRASGRQPGIRRCRAVEPLSGCRAPIPAAGRLSGCNSHRSAAPLVPLGITVPQWSRHHRSYVET